MACLACSFETGLAWLLTIAQHLPYGRRFRGAEPPNCELGPVAAAVMLLQVSDVCTCSCGRRFLGAEPETVLRGNVEEFVAYGFHCKVSWLLHMLQKDGL